MTSFIQRATAGVSLAALLTAGAASAAFGDVEKPPYNQDGLSADFVLSCYFTDNPAYTSNAGVPLRVPDDVNDLLGSSHEVDLDNPDDVEWLKTGIGVVTSQYSPDEINALSDPERQALFALVPLVYSSVSTMSSDPNFEPEPYPFELQVHMEVGTDGTAPLPENPVAGGEYGDPVSVALDLEFSMGFTATLGYFNVSEDALVNGQVTVNSAIEAESYGGTDRVEQVPATLDLAETAAPESYVTVFPDGYDTPFATTASGSYDSMSFPRGWNSQTADLLLDGEGALVFNFSVEQQAPFDSAPPYTFEVSCYPPSDTDPLEPASVNIGEIVGNYIPATVDFCEDTAAVVPTAGNDESAAFYRFASKNRVLTALYAAKNTAGWCDTAILASSEDYADALAAAPLADALNAPILLANADGSLDPQVKDYLVNEFDFVIIASGPGVIPESVRNSLNDAITLDWSGSDGDVYAGNHTARIAGVNRYETAATLAVATLVAEGGKDDWTSGAQFILADGQNFPDALAAGPAAAAASNGVILLTAGDSGVPSFTSMFLPGHAVKFSGATLAYLPGWIPGWPTVTFDWSAIGGFNHQTITVVGGAAKAAAEAGMLGNITEPVEYDDALVGADRYETATMIATKYFTSAPTYYTLASGEDFPDAVVAGGWAANADGPLVLTRNAALPQVTMDYLVDVADNGDAFVVFGGTGSVSRNVSDQLQDTFQW